MQQLERDTWESTEQSRIAALSRIGVLDTLPEDVYDTIVSVVATICGTPIGLVSLVDKDRQWFKSRYGIGACQTSRENSFCSVAIETPNDLFIVPDALEDDRFRNNPLVTGEPNIRFYAGMPLVTTQGYALGSLCVIDRVPRTLTASQREALRLAAKLVVALLERRKHRPATASVVPDGAFAEIVDLVAKNAADGVLVLEVGDTARHSTVRYLNDVFMSEIGESRAAMFSDPAYAFLNPTAQGQHGFIRERMQLGQRFEAVSHYVHADREALACRLAFYPVKDGLDVTHWVIVFRTLDDPAQNGSMPGEHRLVDENRRLRVELTSRIHLEQTFESTNRTTGLLNRTGFAQRAHEALYDAGRDARQKRYAMYAIDIDRFKAFNDVHGRLAGDEMLRVVAHRLERRSSAHEFVGHCTADDFVALIEIRDAADADRIARALLDDLARPAFVNGVRVEITASIGVRVIDADSESVDAVLRDADTALIAIKHARRGAYLTFSAELRTRSEAKIALEGYLRKALDERRFRLAYQPIVSLRSAKPTLEGFESLIRLDDPLGKPVDPARLIACAEESDLILGLGEWITEAACRQVRLWNAAGHRAYVTINVSPKQIAMPDFTQRMLRIVELSAADPRNVAFEITENAMLGDPDDVRCKVDALRATGIGVYLDDFGTGYSSLSYLRRFTFDRLKIDRSFVGAEGDTLADGVVVEAIVTLARKLGIGTVAEGIETATQLKQIRALGTDAGQGYYFSAATPTPEATQMLQRPDVLRF